MTAQRVVSIYLPHFAMERWQRAAEHSGTLPPDDVPMVLATAGPHGPVIHATNRAARLAGVTDGARVVDMKALCPELRVEYGDLAGDAATLERLVLWARRWCPWTVSDGDNGLILDTTGSDHLWGGEAAMLVDMEAQLSRLGLSAQLAASPSWGASWALARFGKTRHICLAGDASAHLAPLPMPALRLDGETVLLLHRLGLKTIADLAKVPRLSLTRRFARAALGSNPLMRLDQAVGTLAEPVSSEATAPRFRTYAKLPEPIQDPTHYLQGLCETLCADLEKKGFGCRKLLLTVYRTDGEISQIEVATSAPSRDPAHLRRLFDDKLDRINPGFGFDLITLDAGATEPMQTAQRRLDGAVEDQLYLSRLVDRLTARFGPRAVTKPLTRESHMPERAEDWTAAMDAQQPQAAQTPQPRPARLLQTPEEVRVMYAVPEGPPARFVWRRQTHDVARYEGPERIAPEWWHDRPSARLRDYFRVENQEGQRLWLYREGLHDDGRGGDPRWFVHGMFV